MLDRFVRWLDALQQRRRFLGFSYAVVKKYGEDSTGYQAALLTYYAFLSLFPLLLLLTTLTSMIIGNNSELQRTIIDGLTDYFPLLGNQLATHVDELNRGGFLLIASSLFLLYGTRGVADVWRQSVQRIWHVPKRQRAGFPKSLLKSFGIILVGGLGLLLASVSAGMVAAAGREFIFNALSTTLSLFILFWVFIFLINFCLPRHVNLKETWVGAAIAALGLVTLQILGGYILAHELKNLDALYSNFALPLGLLFWLYLQAQMLLYAVQVAVVSARKLWPRSLDSKTPTPVDKRLEPLSNEF